MIVVKTADFERAFRKLPPDIQRLCCIQEERLRDDPNDPRLHQKQLHESDKIYSLRVTPRYRILCYRTDNDRFVLFGIGHRKIIYR